MKKCLIIIGLMMAFGGGLFSGAVHAGEIDLLVEKLVEKGYLSAQEGSIILEETRQEIMQQDAAREERLREELMLEEIKRQELSDYERPGSFTLPEWVHKMRIKGDLRVRYENQYRKPRQTATRFKSNLAKTRFRLGVDAQVHEKVLVGAGIRTGTEDPRSGNQSFGDAFSTGSINLDYAYGEFAPVDGVKFAGGKFPRENYIWHPSDMLWDSDIRLEGFAGHADAEFLKYFNTFLNFGVSPLDAIETTQDNAYMSFIQHGYGVGNNTLDFRMAGIYYWFENVDKVNNGFSHSPCTNTGLTLSGSACTGALTEEYNAWGGSSELGINFSVYEKLKRIAFFTDFIRNRNFEEENYGWAFGTYFGDAEIDEFLDWKIVYQKTVLQRDAFLDVFPDSDRYQGQTDIEGHKASLIVGLHKNVNVEGSYQHHKKIRGFTAISGEEPETIYQVDMNLNF